MKNTPPRSYFSLCITGGIGSGKSTVAKLFAEKGAGIVEMDSIAHELTKADGKAMPFILQEFGPEFVNADGSLNRQQMRELVFQADVARKKLEGILHPMIKSEALKQAENLQGNYIIFVIPLLAEQRVWQDLPHRVLLVDCPEELQIERVMARNHMTRSQVTAIMAAQATREERLAIADDVIVNNNEKEKLLEEVARLDEKYKKIVKKHFS